MVDGLCRGSDFLCINYWRWLSQPVTPNTSPLKLATPLDEMPGQKDRFIGGGLKYPYVEGLRLDEAMHPLTLLTVGVYGKALPPQNGAPIRLTVPWKYGFKGIKSIVSITLTRCCAADDPEYVSTE